MTFIGGFIAACSALAACALGSDPPLASSTSATFAGTTEDIPNPDRGFYGWSGTDFVDSFEPASVQVAFANGQRLVLARVSLAAYRHASLPASFLSTLDARFAAVRSAGMKVTLLFAYDFSGSGADASPSRIRHHLEQLKPVLAANADVIPFMRAGFIGAWGEWHSSRSGNSCGHNSGSTSCSTANIHRAIVRDALLANVPATTQIAFRYPSDLQLWYPSAKRPSHVGAHNDCFLAGPTDSGTYVSASARAYMQEFSQHTAFGGETCDDAETPVRSSCPDILSEGPQYHLAWLNSTYARSVLDTWRKAGCYATVASRMGYRIQLDRVAHDAVAVRGTHVAVAVDLRNVGWSRMFVSRALIVTLRDRATGATMTASAGDLSRLPSQANASTRITVNVPVPPSAAPGSYDVLLSAPDAFSKTRGDARFAVRFANAEQPDRGQTWNPTGATLSAGTVLRIH